MLIVVLSMSIGLLLILRSGIVYQIIISFTNREKIVHWFSGYDSLYFSPLYSISFILIFSFLLLFELKGRMNSNNGCLSKKARMRTEKIIIISLIFFTLAICNSVVWLRIVLATCPIGFAVFSCGDCASFHQSIRFRQCEFAMFFLVIVSMLFVFGYWIGGNTLAIFNNNYLYGR